MATIGTLSPLGRRRRIVIPRGTHGELFNLKPLILHALLQRLVGLLQCGNLALTRIFIWVSFPPLLFAKVNSVAFLAVEVLVGRSRDERLSAIGKPP